MMLRYYGELYTTYWRLFFKTFLQYRQDAAIMIGGMALQEGAMLLFIGVIFTNIQQLQGWTFAEVLMTYGLLRLARAVWNVLLDVPHRIGWYVRSGGLDYLLVRPAGVLFQMLGESGLNITSLGSVAISLVALGVAIQESGVDAAWWWALYLPGVVVSGVLLIFSLYLLLACLSFRVIDVTSLLTGLHLVSQLGQFPVTIFGAGLQFLLTWILPFALIGFYPMAFLLRGESYAVYGLLALVVGWLFLALALRVWARAIQGYQSTGS